MTVHLWLLMRRSQALDQMMWHYTMPPKRNLLAPILNEIDT